MGNAGNGEVDPLTGAIYAYIVDQNRRCGRGPSMRQIAAAFALPGPEAVEPHLRELRRRGLVRSHPPGEDDDGPDGR